MVFEKISIVKGRKYKSLVKGYRDSNGKVRHKVIKYLGALNPVNKRRNPNAGRKPKLKVRELTAEEKDFVKQNLKNSKRRITKEERALILQWLNTHPEKLGLHFNNWSHKKLSEK